MAIAIAATAPPARSGARHRVRERPGESATGSTAVSRKNRGSFSAEIDQANRLGRNRSSPNPIRAGIRPKAGLDDSIQNHAPGEVERHAKQMRAVGRGPNEHLDERQHVQVAGRAVFVEGVDQVRAVDGNTERDIPSQIDRLMKYSSSPKKLPNGICRVIGQQEQAADGGQAQRRSRRSVS